MNSQTTASASRRYEKGERRYKHVGSGPEPAIKFDKEDPKKWVGICPSPNALKEDDRLRLLAEAVPGQNGDRELAMPKKLYVVHGGAIYEAQTTDLGKSYHGYPYKGRLSGQVLKSLRVMAEQKGCIQAFEAWVKKYIELGGRA